MILSHSINRFPVSKVRDLKHWIGAPDWAKVHEEAEQRRLEDSCYWFVGQEAYLS